MSESNQCPNVFKYKCSFWQNGYCIQYEQDPVVCPIPVLARIEKGESLELVLD